MVTAAAIYRTLQFFNLDISLNDVCVFIPAGFSILSCLFTMGIAYEASRSANAAILAAAFMAIIPSHLMRSVAGGYDNESVAVAAICSTFYLWIRSQRSTSSWPFAILSGLSYFYMVSAWGGYVFVLNMVAVHAALLTVLNFNLHLHKCYSLFYIIGTIGALQFPIVGWLPFQSMEQLGALFVFLGMQFLAFLLYAKKIYFNNQDDNKFKTFRNSAIMAMAGVGLVLFYILHSLGYVAPLSNRVRSLFIPHTHTGNPLVDSVAEHQSTPNTVYWHYFHVTCYFGPIGFFASFFKRNPGKLFVILYCVFAGYFSRKMIRLVLLLAPAASISAGMGVSLILEMAFTVLSSALSMMPQENSDEDKELVKAQEPASSSNTATMAGGEGGLRRRKGGDESASAAVTDTPSKGGKDKKKGPAKPKLSTFGNLPEMLSDFSNGVLHSNPIVRMAQITLSVLLVLVVIQNGMQFYHHCFTVASELSHPTLMVKARSRDGQPIIIDDFREAYWYLRDNTAPDARVMAWWDYGYQINGIGNRTTIADGNTWNHEHIALLGRCLISNEDDAHRMIRHLADYVLVWTTRWAGMAGDDLAKMPHMARIAASVFSDLNANEYWMDQAGNASPKLKKSILYKMHYYRFHPDITLNKKKFEEVYTSPNRMVRIYKVNNVAPRHPVGSYPPALKFVLDKSKAFKQH